MAPEPIVPVVTYFSFKYIGGLLGGFLLMVGSSIEPSIGVWVISLGGSLLTVAVGKDRSLREIFVNIFVGLFWGIFGSQIVHSWWPAIPQIAGSFFLSMFGVHTTHYVYRNLDTTSFVEVIASIVDRIIPWKKNKAE